VSHFLIDARPDIGDFYYDVAKAAVNRLAVAQSADLKEYGISAITLAPGWTRTERVLAANLSDLSPTESPEYIGRAVACLAAYPAVAAEWTSRTMPQSDLISMILTVAECLLSRCN
jgi:NAD(P)-dependent dehydrogenase (short-subunit alcohol dehydrogenase family)